MFARGHPEQEAFGKGAIVGSVIHNPLKHCNKLLSYRLVEKKYYHDYDCTTHSPFALLGNEEAG